MMNYWTQSERNIYVAAHRGWCGKYPENTMAAFRAALELGVDMRYKIKKLSTMDSFFII